MNKTDDEKYLELKFATLEKGLEKGLERIEKLIKDQNIKQDELFRRVNTVEDTIKDIQRDHTNLVVTWANTFDQRIQLMDGNVKGVKQSLRDRSYIGIALLFLLIFILIPESREAIVKFVVGIFV